MKLAFDKTTLGNTLMSLSGLLVALSVTLPDSTVGSPSQIVLGLAGLFLFAGRIVKGNL